MTDGSSQGLFVVVAVVIFGIFVAISYSLFRDQLTPSLASIFRDSIKQSQNNLNGIFVASKEDVKKCLDKGYSNKSLEDVDFTYTFNDSCTEITISEFKRSLEKIDTVIIPESYLGIPITKTTNLVSGYHTKETGIFTYAQVKKVVLPNTITEIGNNSFKYGILEDINFPPNLETIGGQAFDITSLGHVILPEGLENIGHMAFRHSKLTYVNLPSTLKTIDSRAFSGLNYVKEYHIPESVKSIGQGAFNVEKYLTNDVVIYYNSMFTTMSNTNASETVDGMVAPNGKIFDTKSGVPVEVTII